MNRATMINEMIGEYRVTDFLGAGGMGEVYKARHSRSGLEVAIKIAQESQDVEIIERFQWEAEVHGRLRRQNIVLFKGLTQYRGRQCIVMEYIDGTTLSDRIRFEGSLSFRESLRILESIADAVSYLHGEGIIHRDLKSNNVKIDSAGAVKLLDFGIARSAASPKLTQTGLFVGTLDSASPEQLEGRPADERSDIFSLGGLLYEMTTGRVPFEGKTVAESCLKIRDAVYPRPSSLIPETPREIEVIIARCLKKSPSDRYQNAESLLADVRRARKHLDGFESQHGTDGFEFMPSLRTRWAIASARPWMFLGGLLTLLLAAIWFWPSSSPAGPVKAVMIRTTEGPARVYQNDSYIGDTPVRFEAAAGEWLRLTIKRDGYRQREFTIRVGEGLNEYDYTLEKAASAGR